VPVRENTLEVRQGALIGLWRPVRSPCLFFQMFFRSPVGATHSVEGRKP
jgi:hypothetical protein